MFELVEGGDAGVAGTVFSMTPRISEPVSMVRSARESWSSRSAAQTIAER
jgi:hypothetical protein